MDTFKLINEKMDSIKTEEYYLDLSSILTHISRAEKYFEMGKENHDPNYYNDVIYRTNQAYEGGLRCAYKILLEKDSSTKTTHDLEIELNKEKILNKRVKNMFSIYRNEWRNESIHHYDTIFDQSEALMAINNVSSFLYLLLDQIKEKDFYLQANKEIKDIKKLSFKEFIEKGLLLFPNLFYKNLNKYNNKEILLTEAEVQEEIIKYFKKLDHNIIIHQNLKVKESKFLQYIVDLCLERNNEKVYIEIKIIKNPFAIKNVIGYTRKICKEVNTKEMIIFVWDGIGEYKISENNHEEINLKIIKKNI